MNYLKEYYIKQCELLEEVHDILQHKIFLYSFILENNDNLPESIRQRIDAGEKVLGEIKGKTPSADQLKILDDYKNALKEVDAIKQGKSTSVVSQETPKPKAESNRYIRSNPLEPKTSSQIRIRKIHRPKQDSVSRRLPEPSQPPAQAPAQTQAPSSTPSSTPSSRPKVQPASTASTTPSTTQTSASSSVPSAPAIKASTSALGQVVKQQFPTFSQPKNILPHTAKTAGSAIRGIFTIPGAAGIAGAVVADEALEKAADITGVEALRHSAIKVPTSWAAGTAVDVATKTALTQGIKSLGTRAALTAIGGGAAAGAAAGAVAYGGYKLGEYLGDKLGLHDALGNVIGGGSKLNEKPTGVAGGVASINAKNAAEEAEEEKRIQERDKAWNQEIMKKAEELKARAEKLRQAKAKQAQP